MVSTTYVYKTVGACEIKADVYCPASVNAPKAVIFYIHGGGLIMCSRKDINPRQLKAYVEAGYAVVSIDYRLAPETKLLEIIADLKDAFTWVNKSGGQLFGVEGLPVGVVGHSAGGYLTLMSGFCVDPRPRALVSFYGYGDIVADWYAKPDPFYCRLPMISEGDVRPLVRGPILSESPCKGRDRFYHYCRQNGLWPTEVGGRDPARDADFFVPYCPLRNVTPNFPPTLLLHGDNDTDVPYEQSVLMAEKLKRNGVKHEFITLSGKGHGFDANMHDAAVKEGFTRVMGFLKENL